MVAAQPLVAGTAARAPPRRVRAPAEPRLEPDVQALRAAYILSSSEDTWACARSGAQYVACLPDRLPGHGGPALAGHKRAYMLDM